MSDVELTPKITLRTQRCYRCQRWFGYEASQSARCPHCADTRISGLEGEIKTLLKSNAALRGHRGRQ